MSEITKSLLMAGEAHCTTFYEKKSWNNVKDIVKKTEKLSPTSIYALFGSPLDH